MHYDVIVIGAGGVGSAALWHLARRGARVLGIDQYPPVHDRGSSHGHTRIIRQAYFEHPAYVPLVRRAFELWRELEQNSGQRLYHETGLLEVGAPDGPVVSGVLASARAHGLEVEELSGPETERRWPGFRVPEELTAVYERRAGYLLVEECVRAHLSGAQACGARLQTGIAVQSWSADERQVRVTAGGETFTAGKLVMAPGAWAASLLAELGVKLTVLRKPLFWYPCQDPRYQERGGCPAFLFELPAGVFYGLPQIGGGQFKVGEHTGGRVVLNPGEVDQAIDPGEQARVEAFLAAHLPYLPLRLGRQSTCMYTMSPDSHFLVDFHPRWPNVVFAAGLSGHGFKFTSVLGEVLADLTLTGHTAQPVEFLARRRLVSG